MTCRVAIRFRAARLRHRLLPPAAGGRAARPRPGAAAAAIAASAIAGLAALDPAVAQNPDAQQTMSAAAFEAFTRGRTLTYFIDGEPYGIEAYLPGRQVIWRLIGADCQYGEWFGRGADICFVYDDDPEVEHCFAYVADGDGLREVPQAPGAPLVTAVEDGRPLTCAGFGA